MTAELGFEIELPLAFSDAASRVRDTLKQEGFGILTEIDLQAAFREKLGREFPPYTILGACNPPLAFAAVTANPSVGLLLPCNVTLEFVDERRTQVRLTNPAALLSASPVANQPEIARVAADASERMERVVKALQVPTPA